MGKLVINEKLVTSVTATKLIKICPFNAIDYHNNILSINSNCRMCKMCVRKGEDNVITYVEDEVREIDKSKWQGITVFVEASSYGIESVVYELINKAYSLANNVNQTVNAVFIGTSKVINDNIQSLMNIGLSTIYVYEGDMFDIFNVLVYSTVLKDYINTFKPSIMLYGGTPIGRSLAPRLAAYFKTGLTADCTELDLKENTDLVQTRPAFGGNIMAQIICPNNRPQMATVKPNVFSKPETKINKETKIKYLDYNHLTLEPKMTLLNVQNKQMADDIRTSEVIVAIGRVFKTKAQIELARTFAKLIKGSLACTRAVVENGLMDAKYQIGLSGKTVKPKLIITLGISGSVQFVSGMNQSEKIISVNIDKNAEIFNIADYIVVSDVFTLLPKWIQSLREDK